MSDTDSSCRRTDGRSSVLLAAILLVSGEMLEVKMRNLSITGALIEADELPAEGTKVQFRRGDLSVKGRLAWVDGDRGGIVFDRDVESKQVLRQINVRGPVAPLVHRRPGFGTYRQRLV